MINPSLLSYEDMAADIANLRSDVETLMRQLLGLNEIISQLEILQKKPKLGYVQYQST